jgi:guanylate kinase
MPPSQNDLETRLRGRGTETDDKIQVRLQNATKEMEYGNCDGNFDSILINDNVEQCFMKLEETLKAWFPDMKFEEA